MSVKELERLEAQAEKAGAFVNDYRVVGFVFAKVVISGVIAERDALRNVCAEAYQMAGALNAPVEALDNLSAASMGKPLPHASFLPVVAPAEPVNTRLLTALKACRNKLAHDAEMVAMADVAIMGAEAAPRVARLTMGECMQAVKHISFEEMTLFGIARAIEAAALRKNGLALED